MSLLSQVCLKVLIKDTVSYVCRYYILVRNSILRTFYFSLLIKTGVWIRCSGYQYIQENISPRARKHRYRQTFVKVWLPFSFRTFQYASNRCCGVFILSARHYKSLCQDYFCRLTWHHQPFNIRVYNLVVWKLEMFVITRQSLFVLLLIRIHYWNRRL